MRIKPKIRRRVVIPFKKAFVNGSIDTSILPSIPSGLGPRIKNATTRLITTDTTYIIRVQKRSFFIIACPII
tara:strand:- start:243 stop:458 length:216 start_codon:yes stop_codon:yes gene_type:complete